MYTVHNGRTYRPAQNLYDAIQKAMEWSMKSTQVITVMRGGHSYSWFYRGRELTGVEVEELWKDELYGVV
jgi:phage FluMu gp28-like protein